MERSPSKLKPPAACPYQDSVLVDRGISAKAQFGPDRREVLEIHPWLTHGLMEHVS